MSIKTQCTHCKKAFNVPEETKGKKAKCPSCSEIFEIQKMVEEQSSETTVVQPNSIENSKVSEKEKIVQSESMPVSFKPNKWSFIFLGNGFWLLFLLSIISLIATVFQSQLFAIFIVLGVITGINYIISNIVYKKENYSFSHTHIKHTHGTLFSDNSVDIQMDKITQVYMRLGFIEQFLFKTGSIVIKTAGSGSGKVSLKSIDNPMQAYEDIQKRMQENGFKLKKEHLIQEAKPHFLGIFGESIKGMIGNVAILLYAVLSGLNGLDKASEKAKTDIGNTLSSAGSENIGFIIFIIGIIVLFFVVKFVFNYLDLKRRVYQVYDDSIFYSEGFLSKNYAFLPMEKIADTENSQSFLSKIFGIHDVIVSSEGSNNKVYFFNMVNGKKMMENIKYLKGNISFTPATTKVNEGSNIDAENTLVTSTQISQARELQYNESFLANYQPSMKKVLITNFLLLFPIVTMPIVLVNIIKAKFTNYIVGDKSIDFRFEFLTTKYSSFSVDRITQVIFRESILDKWIGTCSIVFYSIGSQTPIIFKDIVKTDDLYENILSKVGIYKHTQPQPFLISFTFIEYLKSHIWGTIVGCFLVLIFINVLFFHEGAVLFFSKEVFPFTLLLIFPLLIVGLIYLYNKYYYSTRFYSNKVYDYFMESLSGIIVQTISYVTFDDIKAMESKKYPFTSAGSLNFDVSGDRRVQYGKQANQFQVVNNIVRIDFVKDVFTELDTFDTLLNNKERFDTRVEVEKKQDLGNSLLTLIIASAFLLLFILPGLLMNPDFSSIYIVSLIVLLFSIVFIINILSIKAKRYHLEVSRLVKYWGIVYKCKRTIFYKKVDFIEKNQGFINKIFRNGIIAVFTKGSSGRDMVFSDVSEHNELYETILLKLKK